MRSDEGQAGGFADFGEVGVFGKETVAGMNGVGVGDFGGADDGRNVEVAARAFRRADADGFVGEAGVEAVAVGFGIYGDRADAEILAGANDAQGDFAAVGDQNLLNMDLAGADGEERFAVLHRAPVFDQFAATTVPAISASISFISFMDSMMHSTWPGSTVSPILTKGGGAGRRGIVIGPDDGRFDQRVVGVRRR